MKQRERSEGAGGNIGLSGRRGRANVWWGARALLLSLAVSAGGCSDRETPASQSVERLESKLLGTVATLTVTPAATRMLGSQVALEGDTAVVTGNHSLHIFEQNAGAWSHVFGDDTDQGRGQYAVALDGDTVAVDTAAGADVFVRSADGWEHQEFVAPASPYSGPRALALRGDTLVLGVPDRIGNTGNVAYVFTRSADTWTLQQAVTPDDTTAGIGFGESLALGDDLLVVGASQAKLDAYPDQFSGAVFVFERSGSTWSQVQRIDPTEIPDADGQLPNAYFGQWLAMDRQATRVAVAQFSPAQFHTFTINAGQLEPEASIPSVAGRVAIDADLVVSAGTVYQRSGVNYLPIGTAESNNAPRAVSQGNVLVGIVSEEEALLYCATGCDNGLACDDSANCSSGHCVGQLCCSAACTGANESCLTERTGEATGTCAPVRDGIGCIDGIECGSGHCVQGVCCSDACDAATDSCLSTETGLDDGTCGSIAIAISCTDAEQCGSGSCRNGYCCNEQCPALSYSCESAVTGEANGVCAPIKNGAWCDSDDTCGSGHCSEGLCCNSACEGTTQSCRGEDTGLEDGTCAPAPEGVTCVDCDTGFCADDVCCNEACDGADDSCLYVNTGLPNGTCGPTVLGVPCSNASGCDSGYCVDSVCCDAECSGDDESCLEAKTGIADGVCAQVRNGTSCTDDDQCGSGKCREGVCCDSACSGTCESCRESRTGVADGECAPIPEGQDPENECEPAGSGVCRLPGTCNGERGCMTKQGVACGESSCASDSVQVNASTCDGEGNCNEAGTSDCAPYRCEDDACQTSCQQDADCLEPAACVDDHCRKPVALGEACDTDAECGSAHCVEGVCCDSGCTGACESCLGNQTERTDGRCAPIVSGGNPRVASACQASGEVCGADGKCDGEGACRVAAAKGTNCGTACEEGSEQARACDGFGQCATESVMSCLPYGCVPGGTTCASRCEKDDDCAAGATCNRDTGKCAVTDATCKGKNTLLSPDGSETDCAPYRCSAGACRESCSTNNDCQSSFQCQGDVCRSSDDEAASDVDAAAPTASSGSGAKTHATSESGCGCRVGGGAGGGAARRDALPMTLLLLLGLAWRRRSSAVLLAALLSVLGCKKVVQATVNKGDDTTPTESTSENNDMTLADCNDVPEPKTSAGPKMIAVGRRDDSCVWIDTTEVTAAQLLGFVRLAAPDRQDHYPKGCSVSELAPEDYAGGDMPAANVTWCDAAAFCAYAGKRLCAKHEDASEWQTVCTDGDHAEFAYEDLADPEVCNVQADTVADVGSFEDCRTPTGVFDLVGNVREWTAECSGTPPDGSCSVRGGSNLDKPSAAGCDASKSVERVHSAPDIGFRCCADVP